MFMILMYKKKKKKKIANAWVICIELCIFN